MEWTKTEEAKTALLKKCSNIRVWEDLNYEELAELVFKSNIGMIPYKVSGQNSYCPNKFFEYSALGKNYNAAIPSMSRYSPPAHIASTHQEFISLIKEELNHSIDENSKIKLRKISEQASAKETLIRIANVLTNN